jgi:hypothetical protein
MRARSTLALLDAASRFSQHVGTKLRFLMSASSTSATQAGRVCASARTYRRARRSILDPRSPGVRAAIRRGRRTAGERATDAARTAATLFEKLPPSSYADRCLKPLAKLLRFDHSTEYANDARSSHQGELTTLSSSTGLRSQKRNCRPDETR